MLVCCDACERACTECSNCLTQSCSWLCPTDKPSPIFTIFSVLINLAMIVVAAIFLANDGGCDGPGSCKAWWGLMFLWAILNIIFTWWTYRSFSRALQERGDSACREFSRFMLRDIGCYFYIWVWIAELVLFILGPSSMCADVDSSKCPSIGGALSAGVALMAVWLFGGIFFFLMSVTVQCCYEKPKHASGGGGAAAPYVPFPASMAGTGGGYSNSHHHQQQQSHYQDNRSTSNVNNNSSSTSGAAKVAGAVAGMAASAAGAGLSKLGSMLTGDRNKDSSNNNQQQHQPSSPPPPPQHYQQQQPQAPPAQYQHDQNIYNAPPPMATVVTGSPVQHQDGYVSPCEPAPAPMAPPPQRPAPAAAQPQWDV